MTDMGPAMVRQDPSRFGGRRLSSRSWKRLAAGACALVYLALSAVYAFATPMFEKPDEDTHFAYVRHLASGGGLPVQVIGVETLWQQEGSQPPLYYAAASLAVRLFDTADFERQVEPNASPIYAPFAPGNKNKLLITPEKRAFDYRGSTLAGIVLRLLSLPLGLIVAAAAWRVGGLLSGRWQLGALAAALTILNPVFLNVMTAVSNDGLVIALSAVSVCLLVDLVVARWPDRGRRFVALGVLCGLATLTKLSGTLLLPASLIAILVRSLPELRSANWRAGVAALIRRGMWVVAPWMALAGGWFARNAVLYGELTGSRRMAEIAGPRALDLAGLAAEFEGFRLSYFGILGQFNIPLDGVALVGWEILLVVAVAGLGRVWLRRSRWWSADPARMAALAGLAAHFALVIAGIAIWTSMTHASQGRLAFPAVTTVSVALAAGLTAWPGRAGRAVASAAAAFLLLASALAPARNILPAYTPPLVSVVAPGAQPAYQRFGDKAELIGYAVSPASASPGQPIRVRAVMRALAPTEFNYSLVAIALGGDLKPIGQFSTFTGGGLYPSRDWQPGQLWLEEFDLPTSADASAPAVARIELQMINYGTGDVLPPYDQSGAPRATLLTGPVLLPPSAAQGALVGRFGDLAELSAVRRGSPQPDQPLTVTLAYRTLRPSASDLTVFVHLSPVTSDAQPPISQADGPPLGGQYPSTRWAAGVVFTETRALALPADMRAGAYQISVGLYDPSSGSRVPASAADGARPRDDALVVDTFVFSR